MSNNNEWQITVYTDSDWAVNKESRHSVTGYGMFLMGVPILWKSISQKLNFIIKFRGRIL